MKFVLPLFTCILICIYFSYHICFTKPDANTTEVNPVEVNDLADKVESSKAYALDKKLAYTFEVNTSIQGQQEEYQSIINGLIFLSFDSQNDKWFGVLNNVRLMQNNKVVLDEEKTYFTADYNQQVFSKVNLLGLPVSNPLHSLPFMLDQLSYNIKKPLTISQATHQNTYSYKLDDNLVTRSLLNRKINTAQSELDINLLSEDWLMRLDSKYSPSEMIYTNNSTLEESPTNKMTVTQQLKFKKVTREYTWDYSAFTALANQAHTNDQLTQRKTWDLGGTLSLNEALIMLKDHFNENLAKKIGEYLVEKYTSHDLSLMINSQKNNASLIIYSIQKAGSFAAEIILSELIHANNVSHENKQRSIISLGRFEKSSGLTFNTLSDLVSDSQNVLSSTALLSLGTMGKFSPQQSDKVSEYLTEKLNNSTDLSLTILAIKNANLPELHSKVANLLNHSQVDVNIAVIKLLATNENYQTALVNFASSSKQAQSVATVARVWADSPRNFSAKEKDTLYQAYLISSHPIIKQHLAGLLDINIEES